ncbi:MAG: flagellar protein FliT [Thauera sp.]|jgi:hypothetical protein|nr:flagellar protein FliT [Thauera sp.]
MPTTLETLHQMLARYNDMLDLAEANNWEALAAMGEQCAHLRTALQATGGFVDHAKPADLPALHEALQAILALDARIREHTVPCLESTRQLLSGAVRDRSVRQAYAAFGA